MASAFADDLDKAAERLRSVAAAGSAEQTAEPLRRLQEAATSVGEAWSGSPLGYQSRVYYANFEPRPADALWSSEWGMMPALSNTAAGDWQIYTRSAVIEEIRSRAGNPDMKAPNDLAARAKRELDEVRAEITSVLTAFLSERSDELLIEPQGEGRRHKSPHARSTGSYDASQPVHVTRFPGYERRPPGGTAPFGTGRRPCSPVTEALGTLRPSCKGRPCSSDTGGQPNGES
jgi:hypothetical protein